MLKKSIKFSFYITVLVGSLIRVSCVASSDCMKVLKKRMKGNEWYGCIRVGLGGGGGGRGRAGK